jgi:hypothetical protein
LQKRNTNNWTIHLLFRQQVAVLCALSIAFNEPACIRKLILIQIPGAFSDAKRLADSSYRGGRLRDMLSSSAHMPAGSDAPLKEWPGRPARDDKRKMRATKLRVTTEPAPKLAR